jgi:indole-3-glycerol phosphate synthase
VPAEQRAARLGRFLERMRRSSTRRAEALRRGCDPDELRAAAVASPAPARPDLSRFLLIGEIKPRSPSRGDLAAGGRLADDAARVRARAYAAGGAGAISVLTEPDAFGGDLGLVAASARAGVPVLCKDFLVDPLQVYEARRHGASGVLLIARLVDDAALDALLAAAVDAGLFVLLEAFDELDLARIGSVAAHWERVTPLLVGLNARDLATLTVDSDRHAGLARFLPRGVPAIAESGIEGPDHLRALVRCGYRGALIGTALMGAADPAAHLAELARAAREARCASA